MSKTKKSIESGEEATDSGIQNQASGSSVEQQYSHGPQEIKMKPFSTSENPEEAGQLWVKWKKELLTRFRFFRINSVQDHVDAISIYGGELIRELIDTLQFTNR
jgi:hypothetical protein